ncbi:MAG: heterodisulfide reductase [Chloroflexi bacterium]|nr:MAG: heterodisulfide reductase [Chloroflexota bacterium]
MTLLQKPRYVNEEKCLGCTTCTVYCPVLMADPFNENLSMSKATHIYFPQAVPLISYIQEDECLYLKEKRCGICLAVCEQKAIDFTQKPKKVEVKVGAIVLASGFEPFDPRLRGEYGYGRMQNVMTSLEYERLLAPTGPYGGAEILRPSDGKTPRKMAWVQCVGSRQVTPGGNSYCSAVCCTYTQKQVILTKEHHPETECVIFHNDIRSYGKDFERFYERAANFPGVRFVRSYISIAGENPQTKNITIRYSTPEGVKEEEFDLVILSVGLNPPSDARKLAERLGIELEPHGFCQTSPSNPIETSRPGIFVSGAFQGPKDIPESVFTASGAAALCGQLLARRRNKLAKPKVYPPEKDVTGEEPRVGVFVCHCGTNIASVVDVPAVVEYALSLPNVVHAQEQLFSCATNCTEEIAKVIKEKGLNRVVVAACTPRTHEPTFRDTLREAGLNQYYFEMANIREHDSWVHPREKDEATQKAKDLVRMAVARACALEALQDFKLPVTKVGLVIGGGVAGMTSALSLAEQGFEVYLIEREGEIGGMARKLHYTLEGLDVQAYLGELVRQVYQHPLIRVYTNASITEATGYVGNFVTRVQHEGRLKEIRHGIVIVATGAEEYKPAEYLYGEDDRVLTQLELEEKIAQRDEKVIGAQSLVMIQCVGCRNEERNYCSRVCCSHAVKNALKLKEANPEMDIYILFRDMRTYGFNEDHYREAADLGVKFIRYDVDDKPEVEAVEAEGRSVLRVTVTEPILGQRLAIDANILALSAAVIPSPGNEEISRLFKIPLNPDGFFQEAHVKLRPVDFAVDGVFLCGMAHYPKHLPEVISQAYGAACRAAIILSQDFITASGSVALVDEKKCIGCGACALACTYGAVELQDTKQGKKAKVNPVLCKGEGLCNAKCPTGAISLKHYTNEEINRQIDAAFLPELVEAKAN